MRPNLHYSTLRCPHCKTEFSMRLPKSAHGPRSMSCPRCRDWLACDDGDCCVYCRFGSVSCIPTQENGHRFSEQ